MKQSADILRFRRAERLQVFLVHQGGPYFVKKIMADGHSSKENLNHPKHLRRGHPGIQGRNGNGTFR